MNVWALALTVVLLLANGFFVAVEFAVLASRQTRLEALQSEGSSAARHAIAATRELNAQLAGAQLGITIASLLLGFVAEPAIAHLIESAIHPIDLPEGVERAIGFGVGLAIVVFLHMVVGEMVPKNIAISDPERTLLAVIRLDRAYLAVFRPFVRLLNHSANWMIRRLGVEPQDELVTARSAEEIARIVGTSREEGMLADVQHQLLTGALDLGGRPIRSVAVPRDAVRAVPRTTSASDAERAVIESGHSRLLVYGDDLDDVLGFIHAKDLLTIPARARDLPLPLGRIRRMLLVRAEDSLDQVLLAMQRARLHVGLVAEPGHVVGIVTLEDVLEALVGDIRDESDR